LDEYNAFIKSFTIDSASYIITNKRLEFLEPYYRDAISNPDKYERVIYELGSLTHSDMKDVLDRALYWLPPDTYIQVRILISFDIGGAAWAYKSSEGKDYIMFSVPFLFNEEGNFNKEFFLQTTAHEIHHIGFPIDAFLDKINYYNLNDTGRLKLYTDFIAGMIKEGMAQKFCSNAPNRFTPAPYKGESFAAISKGIENWDYYMSDFPAINDSACYMLNEIVNGLVYDPDLFYQRYGNYWTWKAGSLENRDIVLGRRYYYGAELLGVVNLALGREALYEIMSEFRKLPFLYNEALKQLRPDDYQEYAIDEDLALKILNLN